MARVPNLAREYLYSAREQKLENEMLLPSNEKVRNLGVTALYEARYSFRRFSLVTIHYAIQPVVT